MVFSVHLDSTLMKRHLKKKSLKKCKKIRILRTESLQKISKQSKKLSAAVKVWLSEKERKTNSKMNILHLN